MKRYGQLIGLKPEHYDEYVKAHADVWPGVLDMIRQCNIRNYSIFEKDGLLFAYFEYIGEDLDAIRNALGATEVSFEVIVVDDGSSDRTAEISKEKGARVITHFSNRGVGAARKTGIRAARGEIIVMIDAGFPINEVSMLKWSEVDFEDGVIYLYRS